MFPAVFSLSVWSSCSDESVSSKAWSSSSEGKRALRYGMELGRAAITKHSHKEVNTRGFCADICELYECIMTSNDVPRLEVI